MEQWDEVVASRTRLQTRMLHGEVSNRGKKRSVVCESASRKGDKARNLSGSRGASTMGCQTRAQLARSVYSVIEGRDDREIALERCMGKKIGIMSCRGRKRKSRRDSQVVLLGTETGGASDCNVEDDFSVGKKVTDEVNEEAGVMPAIQAPTCVARRTRSQFQKLTSGIVKAGGNGPGACFMIDDSDDNNDSVREVTDEEDIVNDGEGVDNSIFAGNGKDKRDEDDLGKNSSVGSPRNMPVTIPMHPPQQIRVLCDEVSGKRKIFEDDSTKNDSNWERGEVEEKKQDSSDSLESSCVAYRTRSQCAKSKCGGTNAGDNSSCIVIQIDDEDEGNAEEEDGMGDMIKGMEDKGDSVDGESRENESKDDDSNTHMSVDGVHSKDSDEQNLRDGTDTVIPKVIRITNWKFTFDEESQPVEKSEAELEFDKLWMEFEFCLWSCETESGNEGMVEYGDLLQPRLDPCIWGSHDAILDEEIGFKCRHCSIILQEIRDVVASFDTLPGMSHKIIYLRPDSLQKSLLQSVNGIVNIMERRHIASLVSVHPSLLLQRSSSVTGESFSEVRELKGMQLMPQDAIKTKFLIEFLRLTVALKEKVLMFSDYIDPLIFLKGQLKACFSWTEGQKKFVCLSSDHLATIKEDVNRLQMRKDRISNLVFPLAKVTDANSHWNSSEAPEDKILLEMLEHSTITNFIEKSYSRSLEKQGK